MNKFIKNQLDRVASFSSNSDEFLELLHGKTEAQWSIHDTLFDNFNIFPLIALATLCVFGSCCYAMSDFKRLFVQYLQYMKRCFLIASMSS